MKKWLAIGGLILVTVIWGGGFVASDMALGSMKPFQIMMVRFLLASVLMGMISMGQHKKEGKLENRAGAIKAGILMGIALFAGFALQIIGLQYTTPSKNAFLTALNVVIVPFIAFIILKKKVGMKGIIGAIMSVIGVALLSLNGNLTLSLGDGLTLLCAVGFAFQIFFTGEFVKKYPASVLNMVQMITAFVLSAVSLVIFGENDFQVTTQGWLSVLYLGVISTTVCYLLQTACQKYVDETKAAIVLSMESVFGTIFSIIILHEVITLRMVIGCAIILAAVIISNLSETEGEAKGYYSNKKKEIVVKEDMSESQTIKTLIHEIVHAKLYDREVLEQTGEEKDQRTKEIEAESIAYTVCQYFGLDTSDYSFPYIAGWSDNLKMWELRTFMDAIRRTAGEFIKELEEKMKELETDRGERDGIQNEKEIKIGMDTKAVELEQHEGLWHTVEEVKIEKEHFYLMEHNEYGASVAPVLVNGDGKVVAQDLENGLDQEAMKAIREYLEEKETDKKQEKVEISNASLFDEAEREAAYQIEATGQFFFIQETEEGYDYTFYNQEFQELDGGVYDTFDVTLQEAAKTLLLEEGADLTACRKIDSEMLQEQVERAEYFPQKSYEALKPLMESEENNVAFRSGYGYVMLQKISEGYECIIYDQAFREIGGQFYENITASKEEVFSQIFQEEGIGELPCEPFSYEELKKSVIEGEKKRFYEGELTPTSQIGIREEKLLHGESRQNIEEAILCYAQAELEEAGYEEITLLAARVYGSRTRETLYREDSDLDVALSYTGDIREDAFFNLLQENGMRIAGLKIDINPISLEKTGTLQEYIKRAEQYLDEREAEKQGQIPQETLQEPRISFYAAECMEFPSMGEYYENLTLEEAVEKYKTIPADRIHGIKGIGFCLKDGSIYDGEYELMSGGKISKDLIDLVPHYKESPLVQKAMRDLERILAEKQRENTAEQAKPEGTMGRKVSVLKALKERKELLKKQEKKEETSHTRKKEAEL